MLSVFVYLEGSQQGVEVVTPPQGQTVALAPDGRRKAHLYWHTAELRSNEPDVYETLTQMVAGEDRVLLGRTGVRQYPSRMQCTVTDAGADAQLVSLTLLETTPPGDGATQPVASETYAAPAQQQQEGVGQQASMLTLHHGAGAGQIPPSLGQALG